jgi:N-acetylneuraminic acid mutarotase
MSAYHTGFDVGLPSDARGSKSGGGCFRKSITFTAVLATLFSAAALALVVYVGFYTDDDTVKTQPIVIRVGQATPLKGYASARSFFEGTGSWAAKEDLPAGTSDFVAVTVGDKIYLIGGQDVNGASMTVVREYDPVIDDYNSTKAALSVGRMRYGAAAVGTKIYVIGGLAVDDPFGDVNASNIQTPHTTFIYDTATDTWAVGPQLITGRSDLCAFAVGTKVYAVGGYTDFLSTLDSVEVLDTSASSPAWAAAPSLPEARGDVTCAAAGGKGYAIGGFYDPTGTFADLDQFTEHVFELDVAGGAAAWTNKSSMPVAVGDKAAAALPDGSIVVIGGETHRNDATETQTATHTSLQYYPAHDTWVKKAPLPTARFRFAAATDADGYVHAFGGHTHCMVTNYTHWATDCAAQALVSHEIMFDVVHPDLWIHSTEEL